MRVSAADSRLVWKMSSILLCYPDERVEAGAEEIGEAVEGLGPSAARRHIQDFLDWWTATASPARARHYVETLDLQRRSSLYLTYHMYGDSRQRGPALLRLRRMYAAGGLDLREGAELPDYLPVVLEFAAGAPDGYGAAVLREFRAPLEAIRLALAGADTPYRHPVEAACACLPKLSVAERRAALRLASEEPPVEQVGLRPYGPAELIRQEAGG